MTLVQLAEPLSVAQQTLAHCEAGRLCLLAGALPNLAEQLGVSVDDLIGVQPKGSTSKRGAAPKLQQQLERIQALPSAKQRFITQMIDAVLQQKAS